MESESESILWEYASLRIDCTTTIMHMDRQASYE